MAKNKKTKKLIGNILTSIVAILLIAAIVMGVILLFRQNDDNAPKPQQKQQDYARDVNTASDKIKTEEDLKDEEKVAEASNDTKDRQEADNRTEAAAKEAAKKTESGSIVAEPEITYIADENGDTIVGAEVRNINETGGSCTYTFTRGSTSTSVTTGINAGPSYISCEAARFAKGKLTSGTWSVTVKYKSNTAEGESEAQSYSVQ